MLVPTTVRVVLAVQLSAAAASTSDARLAVTLPALVGVYHATGPAGGACRLEIRQDGRYTETCFHGAAMSQRRGLVVLGNTRFALVEDGSNVRFTGPDNLDALDGGGYPGERRKGFLPSIWRQVTWGHRRYLLTKAQVLEFCIAVAEGTEPRTRRVGPFYLREGDDTKAVRPPSPVTECQGPTPPLL